MQKIACKRSGTVSYHQGALFRLDQGQRGLMDLMWLMNLDDGFCDGRVVLMADGDFDCLAWRMDAYLTVVYRTGSERGETHGNYEQIVY